MRRAIRISKNDIEGYNFFTKALVDAGYVEISQTEYIEIEFVKPDPIIIIPSPNPTPLPPPEPPPPEKHIPNVENQQILNAFYAIANQFGVNGWTLVLEAGLSNIAQSQNRGVQYSGPALEDLPLTPAKRNALALALGITL